MNIMEKNKRVLAVKGNKLHFLLNPEHLRRKCVIELCYKSVQLLVHISATVARSKGDYCVIVLTFPDLS